MHRPTRRRTGVRMLIVALTAVAILSSCSKSDGKDKAMRIEDPVCGLISLHLIKQVSGDAKLESSHESRKNPSNPRDFFQDCSVRNDDTYTTFVQLRVSSVVDKQTSLQTVARDKGNDYGEKYAYSGDFGEGYGTAYDDSRGPYKNGAHIVVVRGERTYDLVVYNWSDGTPDQRRKLAEDMIQDIENNLDKAGDSASSSSMQAPTAPPGGVNNRLSDRLG